MRNLEEKLRMAASGHPYTSGTVEKSIKEKADAAANGHPYISTKTHIDIHNNQF